MNVYRLGAEWDIKKIKMRFDTDRQTLSDLNIFPQERGIKSVFDYYNKTQTKGGKDLLLSIMREPLNDLTEINSRIYSIKFLHDNDLYCVLERKDIDAIEYYLKLDKSVLKNHIIDSIYDYYSNRVKPTNEYYLISRGINCLYKHVRNLIDFFENDDIPEFPGFLAEFKSEVDRIKYHPDFNSFINKDRKKLNLRQINRFDHLIRKSEKETIVKVLEFTYMFDSYISLACVAKEQKLGFPTLIETSNPKIKIEGFFHPLIENPVKNDINFSKDENLCFVSGANMAGKSTFLKSIGLCVYLSHIGFPVPARTMLTPLFHGLYTTINISDNINKGYSHYYSEVKRVKDITLLIKERKRVFVIFDELFRGTNVKDAFDATLMITRGFSRIKNSIFLISTHIVEVGKELEKSDSICFKCFESKLHREKPVYNYILKDGLSSERLGLTIMKNEGILEMIDEIAENENK
ncbi:DNA mismatch repair protein MutS domain protein [Paludibacter propionicigenes WB4]|uniref:DNA mismatch repair protein MutS domain protein n=2 Tax=Paludibacter TaxID=346096 RepID=E4T362_PALPW|nr:DNA mismatch repair protein MutS domain protein [Paludibacter propionicigenes WB4]